jgi:uncharacterized integral membrane protein
MGIAFILLGLLAAGLVADFAAENWSSGASDQTFSLFGGSFTLSQIGLVLGAAVLGVLATVFVVLGANLLRGSRGRRRVLRGRIADLERENADLRAEGPVVVRVGEDRHEERVDGSEDERAEHPAGVIGDPG